MLWLHAVVVRHKGQWDIKILPVTIDKILCRIFHFYCGSDWITPMDSIDWLRRHWQGCTSAKCWIYRKLCALGNDVIPVKYFVLLNFVNQVIAE